MLELSVYLSGEIHTNWRDEIVQASEAKNLPIDFLTPNTHHESSDSVGADILGEEEKAFWKDHKSAKINTIRNKLGMEEADLVIVKFGEKYRQWNAAFDAGMAAALEKPYIVIHPEEFTHALKEVDAQAMAVAQTPEQVIQMLEYITKEYH